MTAGIDYKIDAEQILTMTIDMPGRSANTMNAEFRDAFTGAVEQAVSDAERIKGIIITSAKKTFFAGGDLTEIMQVEPKDAEAFFTSVQALKSQMRKLETLGKPLVAAINGSALGGGYELCLMSHHRIVLDDDNIRLGLPEVTLGLLPGGGGTVRLPRLLGLEKALPFLLEGKQVPPKAAHKSGLVDALATDTDDMLAQARAWIAQNPKSQQPWDQRGFKIPGGGPTNPKVAQTLAIAPAMLRQKTQGCYPAPEAILASVVEGAAVDVTTADRIESRYFTQLVTGAVAKNMIGTFWFGLNEIKAGGSRPQNIPKMTFRKVGILGAGMMGAGIAYSCAARGIAVVLKDVSAENAEKGKAYSDTLLSKKVSRGRMSGDDKQAVLDLITPTANAADLQGCDLIIEAVFEDSGLKARVTREAEPLLADGGLFASNTSTIPITQLAEASAQPARFIGLHFFSPVDKMQLVEIIVGEHTSEETLAQAFDFVQQINKVPIVVNDSRGFFTSRVFGTYVNEGMAMLGEGVHPASIENAALLAGMPVGPLALCDEVSLTLISHIRDQSRRDVESAGDTWKSHPAEAVVDAMLTEHGRKGKAAGAGFYVYPPKGKKQLWQGLESHFVDPERATNASLDELKDRFLFIQAIETVRCMEENVIREVRDANIGSIFGIGFAPWTGGALQFINQYNIRQFAARAEQLAASFGERFTPPRMLVDMSERNESFR
ncbi:MAG: 3-hydroxyacyl-CoA dehydrogenase [Alteromonadaceae bacterium]|nr:3-hydroxyacyl-CoA dehydrogenase [Alteromonadaceae bacterium]